MAVHDRIATFTLQGATISSSWEIFLFTELAAEVESVNAGEVSFLLLEGGLAIIPPSLIQQYFFRVNYNVDFGNHLTAPS